jgi:prephenate dehydratase
MSEGLPRYAYLGPAGTFTEAALRQVAAVDECVDLPVSDVASAIDAVRTGEADFAVVAIESTVEGGVTATLDSLAVGDPLVILREMLVPVQFTLAAAPGVRLSDVRRISAHPHAWVQCRRWLAHHLPSVVHVPATSNTAPAALIADGGGAELGFDAALVPPAAVESYGLVPLAENIADNVSAQTRFVVVGHPGDVPARTGADKTTLVVHLPDNEAGALLAMLEQFAVRGVNLSRIESRPIGDALGRYSFSLDAEGHVTDERVGEAVMGLHRRCPFVRFLGSYPRADAVQPTVHVGTADADFVDARAWLQKVRSGSAT